MPLTENSFRWPTIWRGTSAGFVQKTPHQPKECAKVGQFDILSFFFSTTYINNEVMDVMDKCLLSWMALMVFKTKKADSGVRYGAFMPCIPITRRVGDFSHCAARVVNALLKRLEQSLLTENIFKVQHSQGLFDASIRWCRSAEDCASGDEGRC